MAVAFTTPFLLVDDDPTALEVGVKLMARCGFPNMATAPNGAAALSMLRQNDYRAVFSDWIMPEMDGLALLETIRRDGKPGRMPFLMTSIDGRPGRIELARVAGVSAFLLKPFDVTTLKAKITEVLLWPLPESKAGAPLMDCLHLPYET